MKRKGELEEADRKAAAAVCWRAHRLEYLLHDAQAEMLEAFTKSRSLKFVINCSRRLGKSYFLCVLGIWKCIRQKNAQVRYAAPTARMVKKIILPLMREILEDCPEDMRPVLMRGDGVYKFPNGAELHIAGCDNGGAERLRGTATDLGLVDEAGFVDDLEYVVQDILMPQTLTTGGRILLASTPPRTPAHAFHRYVVEAEASGNYLHRTIYANPLITKATIARYMEEARGENSTTWRREYLAEFIVDQDVAVIPEFDAAAQAEIVQEHPRPEWFDAYVSMDPGFIDLTVVLFGYWDFPNAILVVEDEVVLNRTTTKVLADAVKAKELSLWPGKRPLMRVSDVDLQVIYDLSNMHGLHFTPTLKDNKEAQLNALRLIVGSRRIRIHPRCTTLITHLKHGVWNAAKNSFERSGDFGHFDAIDALVYLVRNVSKSRNPFPAAYAGLSPVSSFVTDGGAQRSETSRKVARMLRRR